jgi:signal transduction histidine kinase
MGDIFRLKKENEVLKNKIHELTKDAEKLVENNKLRDKLLYILSHDVHSPLRFSTMVGKAVLTKKNSLNKEEITDALEDINNTSIRMLLLISNILKWIEFHNGNYKLSFNNENLHQLVSDKMEFFRFIAASKNILLINNIPTDIHIQIDKMAFGVIIQNLFNNALKFTHEGEIEVNITIEKNSLCLNISDTGNGMSLEVINNIKKGLRITPQADTENMRGNGLGWGLIKELLLQINGSFNIKSGDNVGTTVSIILPMTKEIIE